MAQNLSGFKPEIWAKELNLQLDKNVVFKNLVNTKYEGKIKNGGDKVWIRSFGDITVEDYSGTLHPTELQSPKIPLLINEKKAFSFYVDDADAAQMDIDAMEGYLERAKIAIELAKDTSFLSLTADVDAGNVIAKAQITKTNAHEKFVNLAKVLKKAGVTGAMKPYAVINPDIEAVLIQSPEFIQANKLGENTLTEGTIGRIAGLDIFVSTNMEEVDTNEFHILASCKAAVSFAGQINKIKKVDTISSIGTLAQGLYIYGVALTNTKAGAVLKVSL